MARKDSLKWRNTLKWRSKSACKDSQFLIDRRSARRVPRHHPTARAFLYKRRSSSCPRIAVRKNGVASLAYVVGIHVFVVRGKPKTWMAGTSPAMTAAYVRLALLEPHAGLIAVGEYDAGFFQGMLDVGEGARLQRFAGLKTRDSAGRDLRQFCQVAHAQSQSGSRHAALGGIHLIPCLKVSLRSQEICVYIDTRSHRRIRRSFAMPTRKTRAGTPLRTRSSKDKLVELCLDMEDKLDQATDAARALHLMGHGLKLSAADAEESSAIAAVAWIACERLDTLRRALRNLCKFTLGTTKL
jgi:hypothetical protein